MGLVTNLSVAIRARSGDNVEPFFLCNVEQPLHILSRRLEVKSSFDSGVIGPEEVYRHRVQTIGLVLLEDVAPKLGIRQTFVVEFTSEDEDALAFDRQAVFVPGDIGRQPIIGGSAAECEGEQEREVV